MNPLQEKNEEAAYYTVMNPSHPAPEEESEEAAYYTAMSPLQDKKPPASKKRSVKAAYYTAMNPSNSEEINALTPGYFNHPYEEFTASSPGGQAAVTSKPEEEIKKGLIKGTSHKRLLCMVITLVVTSLAIVACFIAVFIEVAALKSQSEMTSAQLQLLSTSLMQGPMSGDSVLVPLQQLNNSIFSLNNRVTEQINRIEATVENSFRPATQPNCGPCNFNERLRQIETAVINNSTNIPSLQEEQTRLNTSVNDLSGMLEDHVAMVQNNNVQCSIFSDRR